MSFIPTVAIRHLHAVVHGVDRLFQGGQVLRRYFAKANVAASQTDSSVVAAVSAKEILVLGFRVMAGGTATDITFNSKGAGAGVAISEAFQCGANGGQAGAFSPVGHFKTVAGEALTVTTGAGSTVGVGVVYTLVEAES